MRRTQGWYENGFLVVWRLSRPSPSQTAWELVEATEDQE